MPAFVGYQNAKLPSLKSPLKPEARRANASPLKILNINAFKETLNLQGTKDTFHGTKETFNQQAIN